MKKPSYDLTFYDISYSPELAVFLGFQRNFYNSLITNRNEYNLFENIDKDSKKNINLAFEQRKNDRLLSKKDGTLILPRHFMTVTIKDNVVEVKLAKKRSYFIPLGFDILDGIYTNVSFISVKEKTQIAINLEYRRNIGYQPVSAIVMKKRIKLNLEKNIRATTKEINKRNSNISLLKVKFITNIGEFMKSFDRFSCAHKSKIPMMYIETLKHKNDNSENQATINLVFNNLRKRIRYEMHESLDGVLSRNFDFLTS